MADDNVFLPANAQGQIAGQPIGGWQVILRPPVDDSWRALVHPDFSNIEQVEGGPVRFRQNGFYKNPATGQVFGLVVSGDDAGAVQTYSQELRMACLVLPAAPDGTPPAVWPPLTTDQQADPQSDPLPPAPRRPELDVIFNIQPFDVGGMQPPYRIIFSIDPSVPPGATHSYPFNPHRGSGLSVTTLASNGWVRTTFFHNSAGAGGLDVDSFDETTAIPSSVTQAVLGSQTMCVEVLGAWSKQASRYALTGEVTTTAATRPREVRCSALGF